MKPLLYVRRIAGDSMAPTLLHGQIILASGVFRRYRVGDIVLIRHNGIEKIKRITDVSERGVFLEGDNTLQSTDSRSFGWITNQAIIAKLIWPRHE